MYDMSFTLYNFQSIVIMYDGYDSDDDDDSLMMISPVYAYIVESTHNSQ